MKFTSTAKAVAALVTALALSTVGLAVTALPASAHTPTVSATCAGLTVDLKSYSVKTGNPTPNHVTVTVNGGVQANLDFGGSYGPKVFNFQPDYLNKYEVVVKAYDDPTGVHGWTKTFSGTQAGCVTPKTPKTPGTPTATPQTCTVGDQGQPNLTGGQIVLGTSVGVSTKVMKDNAEVSPLTGLLPGTYVVVASLTDAANSSWGNLPKDWTKNDDGTVSFSVTIGAAGLTQCTVDQPKALITYGDWMGAPTCDNTPIYQTRDVFTAVSSWINGEWVPGTAVKTGSETAKEPMALTADQVKACHPKLPPTVEFGSQTCTVGDQGQPNLTGGQIVLGTSEGVSTKVMKDNAEVSPLTDLLPGTYEVVASLTDAGHSSWGTPPTGWTLNDDGTVSFSVAIGAADLAQCTVDQPKAVITYGDWMGAPTCDNTSIYQTRDVFTAVYSWIKGEWVLGTAVKTGSETATEPMALTADQVKACTMDLTLTKSVISDGPYYAGSVVTYQLAPRNDGPGDALAGWSVTDVLPVGMTLVSISGDGYTCDTSMVCTSSVALAADATGTPITVVAQIMEDEQPGTLKNVAYVSPAKGDVPETNPLVIPTLATDTSTSVTDNDAQAVIEVSAPQVEGIVLTLPNTGTTIPLTWLLGAVGIIAAGVILLGAARFNARGRKI